MMRLILTLLIVVTVAFTCAENVHAQSADELSTEIIIDPIQFSMYQRGRIRGQVTIQLVLEVLNPSDVETIKERVPQIKSDFVSALIALSKHYFDVNKPLQADLIAGYLKPFADQRLGPDKINIFVVQATINPA
jgi:flagellar basal body-associated protein FliL